MTTEAKLKKLEEDQIIMEDQNCKLAKVGPVVPCSHGESRAAQDHACLPVQCSTVALVSSQLLLPGSPRSERQLHVERVFS